MYGIRYVATGKAEEARKTEDGPRRVSKAV